MKRDIQKIDDDIIRKKRLIEQALYSDEDIVFVALFHLIAFPYYLPNHLTSFHLP